MLVIPSIDLQQGKCVRLCQGQFEQLSVYESSPYTLACNYKAFGAHYLHIVDLDGAKLGAPQQLATIQDLKSSGLALQAGGGIRTVADAKAFRDAGVEKIVIGSIAITDPALVLQIIEEIGAQQLVLALDVNLDKDALPKLAIHGWQTSTSRTLWETAAFYQQAGLRTILCTDIAKDGMLKGPNFSLYEEALQRFPNLQWQASGGIRHLDDLRQLSVLGLAAAIMGRALYESKLDLKACLKGG